jgi:hypothetical protein
VIAQVVLFVDQKEEADWIPELEIVRVEFREFFEPEGS